MAQQASLIVLTPHSEALPQIYVLPFTRYYHKYNNCKKFPYKEVITGIITVELDCVYIKKETNVFKLFIIVPVEEKKRKENLRLKFLFFITNCLM